MEYVFFKRCVPTRIVTVGIGFLVFKTRGKQNYCGLADGLSMPLSFPGTAIPVIWQRLV